MTISRPANVNPMQWNEAVAQARQVCARVFRSGGAPSDALTSFGLTAASAPTSDWSRTVDLIAQSLCRTIRKAA
jgi:hypothetical protein